MRKRKKPILLVTILFCSLGGIAAMNYKPSAASPEQPPQTPEVGKDVQTKSKEDLAKDVKNLAKGATPTTSPGNTTPPDKPQGGPGAMGPPLATGPIGLKPTSKPYKPVFNDSATSTQWYTDETPKGAPATPAPSVKKVRPGVASGQ